MSFAITPPVEPDIYIPPRRPVIDSNWTVYMPANGVELQAIFDGSVDIKRPAIVKLSSAKDYSHSGYVIRSSMGDPSKGWLLITPTDASVLSLPLEGRRIRRSFKNIMPKLMGVDLELSTIRILPGLGDLYLRLIGLDITKADVRVTRALVDCVRDDSDGLGTKIEDYPGHVIFEQCLIHGYPGNYVTTRQREGIALHLRHGALIDSDVWDFRAGKDESKGVWIHQPAQHVLIQNNFIYATGSCVFFGGSDIKAAGQIWRDIAVIGNMFGEDDKFDPSHPSFVGNTSDEFVYKNKAEAKGGERILFEGNVATGLYGTDGGQGQAFVFKGCNQFGGDTHIRLTDLTCRYNEVTDVPAGFSLIPSSDGNRPTQLGERWSINNNYVSMDNRLNKLFTAYGIGFGGNQAQGSFLCGRDISIKHNTIVGRKDQTDPNFNNSHIALLSAIQDSYDRIEIKDNIGFNRQYVIFQNNGSPGGATGQGRLEYEFINFDCKNNLSIGSSVSGHLPTGWFQEELVDDVGFVDPSIGNWSLKSTSLYAKGNSCEASDSTDMGTDFKELQKRITPALLGYRTLPEEPTPIPIPNVVIDDFSRDGDELNPTGQGWNWSSFPRAFLIVKKPSSEEMELHSMGTTTSFLRGDIDLVSPNHYAEIVINKLNSIAGTCVRYSSNNDNSCFIGSYNMVDKRYKIYRMLNDKLLLRAQFREALPSGSNVLRTECIGEKVMVFLNGVLKLTFSQGFDSFDRQLSNNVRVGIFANAGSVMDNFKAGAI